MRSLDLNGVVTVVRVVMAIWPPTKQYRCRKHFDKITAYHPCHPYQPSIYASSQRALPMPENFSYPALALSNGGNS